MKKMKRLLALMLVGAMCIGTVLTANAAEFDAAWYAAKNPDVVAVMGNSPEAMKLHYDVFGKKEHRMANEHDVEAQLRRLFNAQEYAAFYPDVKAVFGNNEEAMFNHYISYGILENRRPSEKVSRGAASELRKAVVDALTSAGLDATPGSAELVAIITDSIPATAANQAVQTAMTKTQAVVEKAVENTTAPKASGSSGGGGGSSQPSSSSSASAPAETKKNITIEILENADEAKGSIEKGKSGSYKIKYDAQKYEITGYQWYLEGGSGKDIDEGTKLSNEKTSVATVAVGEGETNTSLILRVNVKATGKEDEETYEGTANIAITIDEAASVEPEPEPEP